MPWIVENLSIYLISLGLISKGGGGGKKKETALAARRLISVLAIKLRRQRGSTIILAGRHMPATY
jgi:hypothetical protein